MKKNSAAYVLFLACLLGVLMPVFCASPEFSADIVTKEGKSAGAVKTMTGRVYVKGAEKMRQDFAVGEEGTIIILRLDKKVTWILSPKEKTYLEMSMKESKGPSPDDPDIQDLADKQVLGAETVNGYLCDKVQYTYKDKRYGVMIQWSAGALGNYPIKIEWQSSTQYMLREYVNIRQESLPDSLFEIPSGYTRMELPNFAEVFGGQ